MQRDRKSNIDEYQRAFLFKSFQSLDRKLQERRATSPRRRTTSPPSVVVIQRPVDQRLVKKQLRALANNLCANHPLIGTDAEVLGGAPHIKGTRLAVRTILAKLHVYGSIQAIVKIYEPHLSEEQVKEALAYAQDFMEIASGLHEVS